MAKPLKFLAFGCLHAPLHDPEAVAWCLERIAKERPDEIAFLGDGLEANAASRWPDAIELNLALEQEFDALNAFLADVRKAAPRARRVYRAGNHDLNLLGKGRIDPRVRSLCDWKSHKNIPEWAHWEVGADYNLSRHRGCSWLGPQICLAHGFGTTDAKVNREAMYFLANAPFGLYLTAHTHRPEDKRQVRMGSLPMSRWTMNVGTLRNMEPDYMERCEKWNWGQAIVVGERMPLKSPRMTREWDAHLEVFRMYDDLAA
jgi:hypothetical protein